MNLLKQPGILKVLRGVKVINCRVFNIDQIIAKDADVDSYSTSAVTVKVVTEVIVASAAASQAGSSSIKAGSFAEIIELLKIENLGSTGTNLSKN